MVVVQTMYFDSDDYEVSCDVIPCASKKVANALVKKIYNAILEKFTFDDEDDRKQWEEECVTTKEDGSIYIKGGDCGYATIDIIEKEPLTIDDIETYEVTTECFY